MGFLTGMLAMLKKIPWQIWCLTGVIVAFWGWGEFRYVSGKQEVQAAWDDSRKRGKIIVDKLKEDANQITVVTETEYVDRVTTIHEKGDEIIKKVPVYIPSDSCPLPGGFRVLHDAAATGTLSSNAREANAAPVSVRAATTTITRNYTTCHETEQRLISLQDWAAEVCQLYNKVLPKKDRTQCVVPYEADNTDTEG